MNRFKIWQARDKVEVIGYIDWSPEKWTYQTDNVQIGIILEQIKKDGYIKAFISGETNNLAINDFIETKVSVVSEDFIGKLSDYFEVALMDIEEPTTWLELAREEMEDTA